jgi:hypothetical protein
MIDTLHVIILDRATPDQINAVQEFVKKRAQGWWHLFESAWIVGGEIPAETWIADIQGYLKDGEASVLVLKLPSSPPDRNWAYYGIKPKSRVKWLVENLKG